MKNNLALNFLLLCVSWCLYLNNFIFVGLFILVICSLVTVIKLNGFNYLRSIVVFLFSFFSFYLVFKLTTLSSMYSLFSEFSLFVSINISLNNEIIKKATGNLNLLLYTNMIILLFLMCVAIVLPDNWYSIFTKTNIYALICFMFVPSCLIILLNSIEKEVKLSYN